MLFRSASSAAPGAPLAVAPSYAEGRVIVRFRAGTSFLPGSGQARALAAGANVHLVDNPPGLSVAQAIARAALRRRRPCAAHAPLAPGVVGPDLRA